MCSIIISTNIEEARELARLNSSRGTHSHSITIINQYTYGVQLQHKSLGALDLSNITLSKNEAIIIHQQAPTTRGKDEAFVHPSVLYNDHYMWHNGIIKESTCNMIKELVPYVDKLKVWDTHLLHSYYYHEDTLEDIDGSFALAILDDGNYLSVARNEIAPLFISKHSIASINALEDSKSIKPNKVWDLYFVDDEIHLSEDEYLRFKTVNNPYYFGE